VGDGVAVGEPVGVAVGDTVAFGVLAGPFPLSSALPWSVLVAPTSGWLWGLVVLLLLTAGTGFARWRGRPRGRGRARGFGLGRLPAAGAGPLPSGAAIATLTRSDATATAMRSVASRFVFISFTLPPSLRIRRRDQTVSVG